MKIISTIGIFLFIVSCVVTNSTAQRVVIDTDGAPKAIGPYSQGILVNETLYTAGQLGISPESGKLVGSDIESQTLQAMKNLQAILNAADMNWKNVVSVQIFLSDINDYSKFNELYMRYFKTEAPARSVMESSRLPRGAKVEILLTAVLTN